MVYPVTNIGVQATTAAVEKWILLFGIPQSIIHDRGTAFFNTDFVNWTEELELPCDRVQLIRLGQTAK